MKKHVKEKRLAIKMIVCMVYLMLITILFVCSYSLLKDKQNIKPYSEVEATEEYTYIDIYKMSEKFAYYNDTNIGIHFVIEKEDTGLWHTYIIAINENDYNKYKNIIDYTYERVKEAPKPKRVYGYPVITDEKIKNLAIKNLNNFLPSENEVTITKDNYDKYLTNSYLDTTKGKTENFDILLCLSLTLLFVVIISLMMTLINKDQLVDNIYRKLYKKTR